MNRTDGRPLSPEAVGAIAILAISTGAIFVRLAHGTGMPSISVAALRVSFAAALLLPFAFVRARAKFRAMTGRQWLLSCLSGAFLALHFAVWIASLETTSVVTSVALVTTTPIWVALAAPLFLNERISRRAALGIVVAMAGAGLMILDQRSPGGGEGRIGGALLAVAGAMAVGGYFLIGRAVRRSVDLLPYVTVTYGSAGLFLLAAAALQGQEIFRHPGKGLLACLLMAIFPQLIGHSAYNWALRYLNASAVAILVVGEPVGCAILAAAFLSEYPGALEAAGCVLLLGGIFIVLRAGTRPAKAGR